MFKYLVNVELSKLLSASCMLAMVSVKIKVFKKLQLGAGGREGERRL
jgi:hypothetical protein